MAHRKNIEYLLEKDCEFWGNHVELYLSSVDCSSYVWQVTSGDTVYKIDYSDIGKITLTSLPVRSYPDSAVREIYQGDNSESSYQAMIGLLADNFVDLT